MIIERAGRVFRSCFTASTTVHRHSIGVAAVVACRAVVPLYVAGERSPAALGEGGARRDGMP